MLKSSAAATGGLIVAFYLPTRKALGEVGVPADKPSAAPPPNAFVRIAPDESITIVINKLEMGQGVNTSMAQLIAEELECDWSKIRSVSAPVNPVYNHTMFATQMTGGSTALNSSWDQHRKIGAGMREMLCSAAAKRWGVPASEVKAVNGAVVHAAKGRLTYGELAEDANKEPFPKSPKLKASKDFKIIGKSAKRVDASEKSDGKATFGLDVRIPGMLYAVVARPPLPTAKLASADEKAARGTPGVVDVVRFGERVAVLAKNTHAARVGRDALKASWKDETHGQLDSDELMKAYRSKADAGADTAVEVAKRGDWDGLKPAKTLTADFEFPYLAHATMEPMNCTIHFDGKTCEIWSGHQMPTMDRDMAAKILGLKPDEVRVNTTYAGGSFGRRASKTSDYVVEASQLAKIVKKPLKVVWTREDDMKGAYYRPMNFHRVKIGLDKGNKFLAWDHLMVGQSVIGGSMFEPMLVKDGVEATIVEGVADTRYNFANFRCRQQREISPVPTLWWRSVGHTHTAYVMETMIDELATATKQDPLKLRMNLLKKSPRHMAVLNLLARETGWGSKNPPKGRAWGLAVHESFGSVVGQVAEVSMDGSTPKVHRVWAAVDCGQVVNPDVARTQVESAIVYGLSAAFRQKIEIRNGKPVQSNFHDYPLMQMREMPEVKVVFTASQAPPTGLGEPGTPPSAPAVANAIFRLTGRRLRSLPFSKEL